MKIFLDSADTKAIARWVDTGIIDGVTTNPSLLSKQNANPAGVIKQIGKLLPDGEISVEVTKKKPTDVYTQAKEIAKLGKNIVVKIPCHVDYYPVIAKLAADKVKLNITLVFSVIQAMMMCKLGATMVSPFIGRWDDIDVDGSNVVRQMCDMTALYDFDTQVLAASIRTVRHLHNAISVRADIATVPVAVLEKSLSHILTDQGIATFDADWKKVGSVKFP